MTPSGRSRRPGSTSTTRTSSCARKNSAVDFFNAKIARYPDYLGRTVLRAGASVLYGVREHPDEDIRKITVNAWL